MVSASEKQRGGQTKLKDGVQTLVASACWLILGTASAYSSVQALITGEIEEPNVNVWLLATYSRATEPVEFWAWFGLYVGFSAFMLGLGLYSLYRIYQLSRRV